MNSPVQSPRASQLEAAACPEPRGEALACGMTRDALLEMARGYAVDMQTFGAELMKEGFRCIGRTTWANDPSTPTTVLISPDGRTFVSLVHRATLSEDPKLGPIHAAVQQAGPRTVGNEIKTVVEIALPIPQQLFQHFLEFERAVNSRAGVVSAEALKIVMDQRYSLGALRENLGHERIHIADAVRPWGKVLFSDLIARIEASGGRVELNSEQKALVGPPPEAQTIAAAHLVMEVRAHVVNKSTKSETAKVCREAVLAIDEELNGAKRPEEVARLLEPVKRHLVDGGYQWLGQDRVSAEAARLVLENQGELLSAGLPGVALEP